MRDTRDIVVIGASAGGVSALLELFRTLPTDLPAAVFVVVHMSPQHSSQLPELLCERSGWRAIYPMHGQSAERDLITQSIAFAAAEDGPYGEPYGEAAALGS